MNSTAIAISANTTAAIAASEAAEAKRIACYTIEKNFNAQTATISEKKSYAECIYVLHPSEISDGALIWLKILIVLIFVGVGAGIFKAHKDRYADDFFDYAMFAFLGALLVPIAALILVGFLYAVKFLVS